MEPQKEKAIELVAKKLNEAGVCWGVGGSLLLYFYGITTVFHDLDLLVAERDLETADGILSGLGARAVREPTPEYATKYFIEYAIQGVEVDLMCGFAVRTGSGIWHFTFEAGDLREWRQFGVQCLPLTGLTQWYIAYLLMPHRETRVAQLEAYFNARGGVDPEPLRRALADGLPEPVRERLRMLLAK